MIIKELGVIQCTCKYEKSVVVSIAIVKVRYNAIYASGGHLSRSLEKSLLPNQKNARKIKGTGLGT